MTDKGTIWFKTYDESGNPVNLTLTEETNLDALFLKYDRAKEILGGYGLQLKPDGVDDNEKLEEVNAWVLGENSKDEPCVFLYSAKEQLQYRIATVWVETIESLPFKVDLTANRWLGAAPERDMAQKKKALNVISPITVVMEKYPKKDGGEGWKYSRIFNATESLVSVAKDLTDTSLTERPYPAETLRQAFVNSVDKIGDVMASKKQRGLMVGMYNEILGGDVERYETCDYLFGRRKSAALSQKQVIVALNHLNGDEKMAALELHAAYKQSQKDKGQKELV